MSIERVTLFHTNDIHSGFETWSKIVAYIKDHRDKNTIYVDIGDHADRSHVMTEATSGKGNIQLLNEATVDYATIGNNEGITFSHEDLHTLYDEANFSVLISNLYTTEGERPKWLKPYTIHTTANGIKIALIGATAPFKQFYKQLDWEVISPIDAIKSYVSELRSEVDVIVVMSHLGLFRDEELAEKVEGIDVILGAHTHHVLEKGKRRYGTLIAQAGKHGAYLGQVTIDVDIDSRTVVANEALLLDPSLMLKEDQGTKDLLENLTEKSNLALANEVATIPFPLEVSWQEQSDATQLLCDALTEWCDEELGMMNAGVLLQSFQKGPITKRDIHQSCPHPINPCVVKITGEQLHKTILRAYTSEMRTLALKGFGFRGKILGRMMFTGIDVELDKNEQVLDILVKGRSIEFQKEYTLATLDMYTFGHLYPEVADSEYKKYFMPELLRDILAWKLGQIWA
ncbi:bifunctional metallophosphatase/5'-nucleotidase [Bacillus sp. FJAT-45037]|uniref:bifunctional metallophosphatase/5'-nucleotidase n=1 Tax=Bacillus sp. FJAT-45037 TaxID=2011007 RepID=UPI000C23C25B|nr:bifunctional UDP-sugar hydrolase/5'-nucleotidase [Bacillus sp. FJAT-45037]